MSFDKNQRFTVASILIGFLLLSLTFLGSVLYLSHRYFPVEEKHAPTTAPDTKQEGGAPSAGSMPIQGPNQASDDTVTILLTASSMLLVVVSLFVAVLAIFGWAQIKEIIEAKVDEAMQPKDKVIQARSFNTTGICFGYAGVDENEEVVRFDLLAACLDFFRVSLRLFEEAQDKLEIMKAKNNLAYFLAVKYRHDEKHGRGDLIEARQALTLASGLPDFFERDPNVEYLLTYARAQIACAHRAPMTPPPKAWKEEVRSSLERIARATDVSVTAGQQRTADRYLSELDALEAKRPADGGASAVR